MTQLRRQMTEDLALAEYALSTRQIYLSAIRELAQYFKRSPAEISREELRAYVTHLQERCRSGSRQRQHLAALKFLYSKTLGRPEAVSFISYPKRHRKLPTVLSVAEVDAVLKAVVRPTYRAVATTIYATGLRISEACSLETRDIDASRGVIHVRQGKGRKARLVPLSGRLLSLLRAYWRQERPPVPVLFAAPLAGGTVRPRTVRQALRRAGDKAGVDKRVTPHVLRHSFATHQLQGGTEIRVIQAMLGHSSVSTTTRYAQVSVEQLRQARSRLDQLPR